MNHSLSPFCKISKIFTKILDTNSFLSVVKPCDVMCYSYIGIAERDSSSSLYKREFWPDIHNVPLFLLPFFWMFGEWVFFQMLKFHEEHHECTKILRLSTGDAEAPQFLNLVSKSSLRLQCSKFRSWVAVSSTFGDNQWKNDCQIGVVGFFKSKSSYQQNTRL